MVAIEFSTRRSGRIGGAAGSWTVGKSRFFAAPFGHRKTTTFAAASRYDGLTAPCVFDGPVNGEKFRAYVEQVLAPTLRPGEIVVVDNRGTDKRAGVRQTIEAAGAERRFLPSYSPDLDPIEQVFAKVKGALRKMATRTVDGLRDAIAVAIDDFPPNERRNDFRKAGHAST
jgi:transposase